MFEAFEQYDFHLMHSLNLKNSNLILKAMTEFPVSKIVYDGEQRHYTRARS